ncbi:hypothetical protein [Treponema zioleckii]|uniref:hypothetical protein n=1 Tax=Treponema zioleckii TaxID=331680 RepID=UPI00168B6FB9|nr:hypothetical protein [Treponema zioleckii]
MNIIHRISYNDKKTEKIFQQMNIKSKGGLVHYFDIGENDCNWEQIKKIVNQSNGIIIDNQYKTIFSKKELALSKYFVMIPTWHFLYPEPQNNFGYEQSTYNSSKKCVCCNRGLIRKDLFAIQKEPKWGSKDIGQLNWIFDEFFVTEKLKKLLSNEFDMTFSKVRLYQTNDFCQNTFNLEINAIIEIENKDTLDFEICPKCGNIKYHLCHNNFFPKIKMNNNHIARTKEFFGSGNVAYNQVIIDRALYDFFIQNKIKGVEFIPTISEL